MNFTLNVLPTNSFKMSGYRYNLKKHFFLLFFPLQCIFHVALSIVSPYPCGKEQDDAINVWSGQNVSKRFYLQDGLRSTQTLVWTKGESKWAKRHDRSLEYFGDEVFDQGRYRLTEVSNITYELFIDYTEENDSGNHIVIVYEDQQQICTAFIMNLTVKTPESICSTRLNKDGGKLKMSCSWVQMNEGDRAHFEVGNEVLYEHQIPELNFEGTFNMTHYFSVNIGLDRFVDEITVPPMCVVSQRNRKVRDMCEFPVVRSYPSEYIHNEIVDFECCSTEPSKPLPLLYDYYGITEGVTELQINSSQNYNAKVRNCILLFLCGEKRNHSEVSILKMESLEMKTFVKNGGSSLLVSVEDLKRSDGTSMEDEQCIVFTVNFEYLDSTLNSQDEIITEILETQNYDSAEATGAVLNTMTTAPWTKRQYIIMAAAAIAALVLAFIVGACIMKCYYTYNIPGKDQYLVRSTAGNPQRGPSATEDDSAVAIPMTTFTPQTPQQHDDATFRSQGLVFNQQPLDETVQCFEQDTMGQCFGPPALPLRREMVKHDSGRRLEHVEGVKRSNAQHIVPTASGGTPKPDSTYCSVDDVEVLHSKAKNHESYGKKKLYPSSSRQKKIGDDLKGTISPTPDLDELYAKPDMTQKTKNKASLETEYDNPRPPGNDFLQRILVQKSDPPTSTPSTYHANNVYGNAVGSPTDESTSDGELYINTAGSALI